MTSLSSLCSTIKKTINPQEYLATKFKHYSIPNFDEGHPKVVYGQELKSNKILISNPCILFSRLNPRIRRVWDLSNLTTYYQAIASTEFVPFIIKDENQLYSRYLFWFLHTTKFLAFARAGVVAATKSRERVKKENLFNVDIPLPPLEEQKRIAEILDRADAIRQKRKRAIALTEELARSTFLEMFGDPVTNPKGWEIKPLENILNVIYRYPSFYGCKYVEDGVPVIKISNINKEYRVDKDLKSYDKVSHSFSESFPKTIVKENDLVMAVRGDTTGKVGLIPYELQGANLSPNLIRLSPNYDICLPSYLFWVLRYGKPLIENRINNTAKKSLTATTLKDVHIPIPPKDLQEKFQQIFERLSYLKYKAEINQNNEDNLFNSL